MAGNYRIPLYAMGPANASAKGESTLLRSESPRMHMSHDRCMRSRLDLHVHAATSDMSARNMESTGKKSVWNGRTPPDSGYGPTPEVLDAINLNKQMGLNLILNIYCNIIYKL